MAGSLYNIETGLKDESILYAHILQRLEEVVMLTIIIITGMHGNYINKSTTKLQV